MRIAFLLTQSLDSPSGLGRYSPLSRELVKLGHEVEIYALHPDWDSLQQKQFVDQGVSVYYVAPMHVQKRGSVKSYYSTPVLIKVSYHATWKLIQAALHSPAEIVHIGKPHPMNAIAGLVAKYLKHKIVFLDCDDIESASNRFSSPWQRWTIDLFEKKMPHRVHFVTTNTRYQRERLLAQGIPVNRVIYLPNGVDLQRFTPPDPVQLAELKERLGLQNKRVVTYIGSLSLPSHRVDLLVEAFCEVLKSIPEALLLLVGGGEDVESLQTLVGELGIAPGVRFCGRIDPDQVGLYYHLAEVSVDPVDDTEAARGRSPLKLFESWACGIPFVTADVGDRRSLLGSPPAGILVQPGNRDSLAKSIIKALQDRKLSDELVELGESRVRLYSWDKLATQLESTYALLNSAKSHS
jgi:glycosyltransferase involved in cell wall biosynthesis